MNILLKLYPKLNLGDDLFLKIICERYPDTNFRLLADQRYIDNNQWDNLQVYNSSFKDSLFNKIKRVIKRKFFPNQFQTELQDIYLKQNGEVFINLDGFVSIGGSIFIQIANNVLLDTELAYYYLINKLLKDKPKFFIGCNFGPYKTLDYVESYKSIFKQYTDICFREEFSYNLFKEISQVRLASDVVFGMKVSVVEKLENTIGFSIVPPKNGIDSKTYIAKYVELITFYQQREYKVYLVSFCKDEGDEEIINTIIAKLEDAFDYTTLFYNGNITEFLDVYGRIEYMFCGRFHAMILSMLYNQKIYPIAYSDKMKNVLDDIDYKGDIIETKTLKDKNVEDIHYQIDKNGYDISKIKVEASKQFYELDKFLS